MSQVLIGEIARPQNEKSNESLFKVSMAAYHPAISVRSGADQPAPSAQNEFPNDSRAEDASPKLGFYTSLTRKDDPPERLTLNNKKPEAKAVQAKPVSLPKPQEEQKTDADKNSLPAQPASAGTYFLQLGAFQQAAKAETLMNELRVQDTTRILTPLPCREKAN